GSVTRDSNLAGMPVFVDAPGGGAALEEWYAVSDLRPAPSGSSLRTIRRRPDRRLAQTLSSSAAPARTWRIPLGALSSSRRRFTGLLGRDTTARLAGSNAFVRTVASAPGLDCRSSCLHSV